MNPEDTNHLSRGSICWATKNKGRLRRVSPNSRHLRVLKRDVRRFLCLRNCYEKNDLLFIFIKIDMNKFYLHHLTGPSALPGTCPAPPKEGADLLLHPSGLSSDGSTPESHRFFFSTPENTNNRDPY